MEKYLITGFSGFVSKHFIDYLEQNDVAATVLGIDLNKPEFDLSEYKKVKCSFQQVDLLNKDDVDRVMKQFRPDYILHLASYSSVAFSWQNPVASFTNNTNIFLNLIERVRALGITCRILSVGSSEEYGNVSPSDLPLREDHLLNPLSPYAVARVAQELLSKVFVTGYGSDIILTRSFNHIGPGQKDVFVIASFAKKLVDIKRKKIASNELATGDLTIVRDFVDVRDVVRAYYLLLKKGRQGEVYNICSGKGTSLADVLDRMTKIIGVEINHKLDQRFVRPGDIRVVVGSNDKIKNDVGWKNEIGLDKSLKDILEYYTVISK
ncbi:MAG: GDP-mannose 4,6-dehydratase [Bacteroidetes bacterium]|nr:GDP-mannose 4,6-dehydratase [Bacteroidota bacterium]